MDQLTFTDPYVSGCLVLSLFLFLSCLHAFTCPSVCLCLSIRMPVFVTVSDFVILYICLLGCLFFFLCLLVCLSVCVSLSLCLSVCLLHSCPLPGLTNNMPSPCAGDARINPRHSPPPSRSLQSWQSSALELMDSPAGVGAERIIKKKHGRGNLITNRLNAPIFLPN